MLKNKFFFTRIFFILFSITTISSCGKTFSGAILEKEDNNKTYIEPDGKTFHKMGFSYVVDIQPYITITKGAKGLVLRGEYDKFSDISILGLAISNGDETISTECDKRYSRTFIKRNEICDGLLANSNVPALEKILESTTIDVTFNGEKNSIQFEMTDEQKEVFAIILKKYSEL